MRWVNWFVQEGFDEVEKKGWMVLVTGVGWVGREEWKDFEEKGVTMWEGEGGWFGREELGENGGICWVRRV